MELVIILLVAGTVLLMLETVLPGVIVGLCGLACWMAAVAVAYIVGQRVVDTWGE